MADPKAGFKAVYGTHRALEADHSAYMTHGGLIVRCTEDEAPAPNTDIVLRVEAPSGRAFDFAARAGQYLKKKGFMVSFEDAKEQRDKLDSFVSSEAFRSAVAVEGGSVKPPEFGAFDPASEPPPTAEEPSPFDDATPFDTAPPAGIREPVDTTALHPDIDKVPARRRAPPRKKAPAKAGRRTGKTELRKPAAGTEYPVYAVKYPTVADFTDMCPMLEKSGLVEFPFAEQTAKVNDVALLRLILPGRNQFEAYGVVEVLTDDIVTIRVNPESEVIRKAVLYPSTIAARKRREGENVEDRGPPSVLRIMDVAPDEEFEKMPIRRRLARMGMDDKINMALSGNREERMALAMDGNRAVHHYLLKNAKITLDEIAYMSRLPSLNPDVLEKIAENPMYTQNPTVTKALVYNPKTPIRTAIRLLDRLPRPEVMNLAKRNNMNLRLVMAKKKIERFKG